jgi:hypothetical protein
MDSYSADHAGGAMPDFEIVSVKEAQLMTIPGRRGRTVQEYAAYIRQLSQGQAGKLHLVENEKPITIRRRLGVAAQALGITLVIRRSGDDLYFWDASSVEEQPSPDAADEADRKKKLPC